MNHMTFEQRAGNMGLSPLERLYLTAKAFGGVPPADRLLVGGPGQVGIGEAK